jgi:hypothetical protein
MESPQSQDHRADGLVILVLDNKHPGSHWPPCESAVPQSLTLRRMMRLEVPRLGLITPCP